MALKSQYYLPTRSTATTGADASIEPTQSNGKSLCVGDSQYVGAA